MSTSRIALDEGRDIGEGTGTPVNPKYDVAFKVTGKIYKVAIDLTRDGRNHHARNRKN